MKVERTGFIGNEAQSPYFQQTRFFEPLYDERPFVPEPINEQFEGKDILSLNQFSRDDLEILFRITPQMREVCQKNLAPNTMAGFSVLDIFYSESTRTLQSFQTAAEKMGAGYHAVVDPKRFSSEVKGESFEDTIRTLARYMDITVMRHKQVGAMAAAAHLIPIPLINAGEGKEEHPTQGILDLNTIYSHKGKLEGLHGVIAGDLRGSRTTHSLLRGLANFPGNHVTLLALPGQELPPEYVGELTKKGLDMNEISTMDKIPKETDYWYWTRPQLERLNEEEAGELQQHMRENPLVVTQETLDKYAEEDTILLHPLPRDSENNDCPEILPEVDHDPRSLYLTSQLDHGLWTRMTLLGLVSGRINIKNPQVGKSILIF